MGAALELVVGTVTAPGANFTAMTAAAGNSFTVRATDIAKNPLLIALWADFQSNGTLRIRSPKLHDNVQGIRADVTASDASPLWPIGIAQRLWSQDVLTVEAIGSAAAGDIESMGMLIYYPDLPGANARLITAQELMQRMEEVSYVENTLALGTAGGYSGEEAINAEFDQFKANEDYALIGYMVDVECAAVRWRGADTANLGVGGPGNETLRHVTAQWFLRLSLALNLPLIPVFNSANRGGILVDGVQDENGADTTVTSIFARLRR